MKEDKLKIAKVEIKKIQEALDKLNKLGYILDFVENQHCICDVKKLKEEMRKPFKQIDIRNYVIASLDN